MRWIALLAFLWCVPAVAQNTTCATRAAGDSSNACASTAFVGTAVSTGPTISANSVWGNATSGSAAGTSLPVASCSTSASALAYTTNTGFSCNSAINAATLGGATFASPGNIGTGSAGTGTFTGVTVNGTLGINANSTPYMFYDATGAAVDSKVWESYVSSTTYHFGTNNDTFNSSVDAFTITRTANLPKAFTIVPVLKSTGGVQITQVAIASLPACNAGNIGLHFIVSNGTAYGTGTYGSAVSATGAVTRSVLCTNTAGATTYAWAYN